MVWGKGPVGQGRGSSMEEGACSSGEGGGVVVWRKGPVVQGRG